jgi:hypothetical protein
VIVTPTPSAYTVDLNEKVLAGRPLSVCVLIDGPASISLLGSATQDPAIQVRLAGRRTPSELALALLRPQRSLLSLLPGAFSRASLFRPGCVGRGPSGVSLLGYWRPSRSARPQSQPPPVRTNMRAVMGAAHPSSGSSGAGLTSQARPPGGRSISHSHVPSGWADDSRRPRTLARSAMRAPRRHSSQRSRRLARDRERRRVLLYVTINTDGVLLRIDPATLRR